MKILDVRQLEGAAIFALCAGTAVWVTVTGTLSAPWEIPRAVLMALLFLVSNRLFMNKMPSPTGSGAIVMAIGIFINGALVHFPLLNTGYARSLAMLLFILLLFIVASYVRDAVQGRAFTIHFAHPVTSFAVGTWIAGTSVCGVTLCQRLPEWRPLVQVLVIGNIGLWLYFVSRMVRNFIQLFATGFWRNVHGVLLLSTVSTQSLVVVWKAAFGASWGYQLIAPWVIALGVLFYCVSFYLIVRRYVGEGRGFDLDKGWFNTNCIIHGAMSITGLASVVSGVVPTHLTLLLWLWVIFWFVVVEVVELARAGQRLRRYGLAEGLLVYDPTQWSRNFTFGMLYAFTLNFDLGSNVAADSFLRLLHQAILHSFAWVVLALLLVEISIFFRDRLSVVVPLPESKSRS